MLCGISGKINSPLVAQQLMIVFAIYVPAERIGKADSAVSKL